MITVEKIQEAMLRSLRDQKYELESIVIRYFRHNRFLEDLEMVDVIDLLEQWKCVASQIEVVESMGDYVDE